jgi:hypothetical protein
MGDLERRLGSAAAYVGGAITAAGTLAAGVLLGQVVMARLTIPGAEAPPPRSSGLYGREYGDGAPLRLAVLGDSTAAGYGVHTRAETPGALLAGWIAEAAARPVRLTCPAVVGSLSAWLAGQVETVLEAGADLAIIFIGANDVTAAPVRPPPPGTWPRPSTTCAPPGPRWSWRPVRTSAPSSPSSRRCAGWPAGGAGSWPRHRRWRCYARWSYGFPR